MRGSITGDIAGSAYEFAPVHTLEFPLFPAQARFTDDAVLTVATAEAILSGKSYGECYQACFRAYPDAGYGARFEAWARSAAPQPYQSWGNGSAMRVSPVGWAFTDVETVLEQAKSSAACTHDHPQGIAGAQAVALAVFLARSGASKAEIRSEIESRFGYDLQRKLAEIRPGYRFEVSCARSVPEALIAFLEASDFESALRNAISLGGDSDTQACIAGAIAEAFYQGVPEGLWQSACSRLDEPLLAVTNRFAEHYLPGG